MVQSPARFSAWGAACKSRRIFAISCKRHPRPQNPELKPKPKPVTPPQHFTMQIQPQLQGCRVQGLVRKCFRILALVTSSSSTSSHHVLNQSLPSFPRSSSNPKSKALHPKPRNQNPGAGRYTSRSTVFRRGPCTLPASRAHCRLSGVGLTVCPAHRHLNQIRTWSSLLENPLTPVLRELRVLSSAVLP